LDAGGGTGKWAIPISKLAYRVTLTDISEKMLEVAKQKLAKENLLDGVQILVADVTKMDAFNNDTFDFVLCEGDPLSYCSNPYQGIRELVRVAKKGSSIVASVDNLYSRLIRHIRQGQVDQAIEAHKGQWVTHEFPMYFFKPVELMRRFEEAGCTVVKMVGKNIFSQELGDLLTIPETLEKVLSLELECCGDQTLAGAAGHVAVVCRRDRRS